MSGIIININPVALELGSTSWSLSSQLLILAMRKGVMAMLWIMRCPKGLMG